MNITLVDSRLAEVKSLPALPEVAITLLRILTDSETRIDTINNTMSRDPALSGTMLRIVNSSYYGLRHKVSSLPRALSLLGYRTVKNIVLTAAASGVFQRKGVSAAFDARAFARHSIATAAICRFLGRFTNDFDPEVAFSAGLLHDIGKLAMDHCFPEEYAESVRTAKEMRLPIVQAEKMTWGCDHAAVGRLLAQHWKLPDDLCSAIAFHHELSESPQRRLTACCYMADYVCAVKSLSMPDRFVEAELDHAAWECLRLDSRVMPELMAILDQEIEEAALMFSAASTGPSLIAM